MVILISALAVVVAAVLLASYFVVGGGFALIYGAVALAALSMVLLWAARWIGSTAAVPGSSAPEPLPERVVEPFPSPTVRPRSMPAGQGVRSVADGPDAGLPVFPIAEYDTLWVSQIVPLLAQLGDDELAVVEARERGGRHRAAVLDAIAAQRGAERIWVPSDRSYPAVPSDHDHPDPVTSGDGPRDDARPEPEPEPSGQADADPVPAPAGPSMDLDLDPDEDEEARWSAWAAADPGPHQGLELNLDLRDLDLRDGNPDDLGDGDLGAGDLGAGDLGSGDVDLRDPDIWIEEEPEVPDNGVRPAADVPVHAPHPSDDLEGDPALYDWTLPTDGGPAALDPEDDSGHGDARSDDPGNARREDHPADDAVGPGGVRVRTFLGRRQSTVTVRRDR
ncbi:MAG: hypothetical protein JWM47_470 [Acidimicrobiales bacterium]|nr:hypothetical protein [Acidimicrobiales bacterium]